ncbi:MAG: hypothetical protein PHV74_13700 [Dehalococcoidia bacterium]|nr:hypothetical protein [Dehalococcoidia bacterium]
MIVVVVVAAIFATVSIALFISAFMTTRRWSKRSRFVGLLLQEGNISGFIGEMDKDIANAKHGGYRTTLLVNKTTGLYYKGEWAAAVNLLKSIDPAPFPRVVKAVYYNNFLLSTLSLGRIDEANEICAHHSEWLTPKTNNQGLNCVLRSTVASLAYYNGKLPESKSEFMRLLGMPRPKIYAAVTHYFLGLISLKENCPQEALGHFDKAAAMGSNTWLPASIRPIIDSLNRSN